jgi:hypothetical protein
MTTGWTCICVTPAACKPFFDTVVPEYVMTWERDGLVSCAEGFGTDAACIGWVKLCVDKVLHYWSSAIQV